MGGDRDRLITSALCKMKKWVSYSTREGERHRETQRENERESVCVREIQRQRERETERNK